MARLDNLLSDARSNLSSLVEKPMAEQSRSMKSVDALQKLNASHQARYGNVTGPDDIPDRGRIQRGGGKNIPKGLTPGKSPSFDFLREAQNLRGIEARAKPVGTGMRGLAIEGGEKMLKRAMTTLARVGVVRGLALLGPIGILAASLATLVDVAYVAKKAKDKFDKRDTEDDINLITPVIDAMDAVSMELPEDDELPESVARMNPGFGTNQSYDGPSRARPLASTLPTRPRPSSADTEYDAQDITAAPSPRPRPPTAGIEYDAQGRTAGGSPMPSPVTAGGSPSPRPLGGRFAR